MKIVNNKSTDNKAVFNIIADLNEITESKNRVLLTHQKDLKLSGFRAGKAPLNLVEKNIDTNLLSSGTLDEVINLLYNQSIIDLEIKTLGQPKVDILKFVPFTNLEIKVEVDKLGKVTLPDLNSIKLSSPSTKVTPKLLDDALQNLRLRAASYQETNSAAKNHDRVTINFKGSDPKSNEEIKGTSGDNYPLVLGSNSFIPGFETELIGLKVKDKKDFLITFPKDYSVPSFANRKVKFAIVVIKVEKSKLDELDDKFAAKLGPFKNLDELKKQMTTEINYELKIQAKKKIEDEILNYLADNTKTKVPQSLIEDEVEYITNSNKKDALSQGMTWEEFLANQKMSEEQYNEKNHKFAKNRVISGIAIGEIAQKEGIEISNEELDAQIEILKEQYTDPSMQEQIDDPNSRREIVMRMITEKVLNFIASKYI